MSKNTNLSFLTDFITADIVNSRVGINNASPQTTFDVTGTGKFSGILTLGSTISNGTYAYTLPSATGTLALTSDIPSVTGYVPYTGATQAVNLGYNSLSASFLRIDGAGPTLGSYLGFKHSTNVTTGADGYTSIYTFGTNTIAFKSVSGATTRDFSFSMASITPGVPGGRTYTLPDADGTLALTSQIPANPVGGTGTAGQVTYWSSSSEITGISNFLFNASERNLTIDRSLSTLGNAITISKGSDVDQAWLAFRQGGGASGVWRLGYSGDPYDFRISAGSDSSLGTQALRIFEDSQNVVVGTAIVDNGTKLQVGGSVNIVGNGSQLLFDSLGQSKSGGIYYTNDFELLINNSRGGGSAIYLGNVNMDFHTNVSGNPRLRIESNGNLGIGTSTPTSSFNARLAIRNEDAANNPTLVLFKNINSASSEDIFRVQSWNGAFNTVASIRANGGATFLNNVLIGTQTDAGSRLQIEGGNFRFNWANPSASYYLWLNRNSSQDGGILLTKNNSLDWQINNTGSTGDLIFYSYGIANPSLTLTRANGSAIFSSSVTSSLFGFNALAAYGFTSYDGATASGKSINFSTGYYGGYDAIYQSSGNTNDFGIWTNGGGVTQAKLYIKNNGNVLIGTSTDIGTKLQVNGTTYSTNYISGTQGLNVSGYGFLTQTLSGQMTILGHNISASDSVNNQVNVVNGGWYSSMIKMYYSEGITFHTSTTVYSAGAVYPMDATERIKIKTNGEVIFHNSIILRNGQMNSLTSSDSGQSMYLNFQGNGTIYAGSSYAVLYAGSDERIKTEINHSQSTLTKILNLTPRTFKYKERPEITNYGFVAQEVEAVMPELVRTSEGITMCLDEQIENQKNVESYGLAWAAILVKAIQEQQQQIQELKNKLS